MLVFTRRRNEGVMIGDGIEVTVLRVGRDGVRLGVRAPDEVPVHRREIYDQIRKENLTAACAVSSADEIVCRLRRLPGRKRPASESELAS